MKTKTLRRVNSHMSLTQKRKEFVEEVIKPAGIRNRQVLTAFLQVPRHKFVLKRYINHAYEDRPLPLESGQTISQPSLVALMTELLTLDGSEKVLEIGTGSGYQAAILSRIAKEVYTIERIPVLAKHAESICRRLGYNNIHFRVGDGSLGLAKYSPYDAIIVTAGAKEIPQPLIDQLKVGGRLVIPIGETLENQKLRILVKTDLGINSYEVEPVAFVPLIGKFGWKDNLKTLYTFKN